jgi:hypothetical protein
VATALRLADFRLEVVTRGKIVVCVALATKCALGNASRFIEGDAE